MFFDMKHLENVIMDTFQLHIQFCNIFNKEKNKFVGDGNASQIQKLCNCICITK